MVRVSAWIASLLLCACTASNDEEATFGVPTGAGSNPGSSPGSADDGSGDSGSGSGSGESTAGGSDDAMGSTSSPVSDSSGGAGSTGMPGDESTTGMMPPGNGQPADGMYSDCLDAMTDCAAPTNVCFVINDNDGFCTAQGCTNPATDCDPAPGGTATPTCFPIQLNGMANMSCVLSCTGGLMCPPGMTCYNLAEGGVCA